VADQLTPEEPTPEEWEQARAETAEALQAYIITVAQPLIDIMVAHRPLIEAYARQLSEIVRSCTELVDALESTTRPPHDRPAHRSPYGPANVRRRKN
jgi:hypothetical protein